MVSMQLDPAAKQWLLFHVEWRLCCTIATDVCTRLGNNGIAVVFDISGFKSGMLADICCTLTLLPSSGCCFHASFMSLK